MEAHLESTDEEAETLLHGDVVAPKRPWRFAMGVFALALLLTLASTLAVGKSSSLLAVDAAGLKQMQQKYATSTEFCYENNALPSDCWAQKPAPGTPVCSVDSGTTACMCPVTTAAWSPTTGVTGDAGCNVDNLPTSTGRCSEKIVYVNGGTMHHNSAGQTDVSGTRQDKFCKNMVKNDQWQAKHLVPLQSDGPSESSDGWWGCLWKTGYAWRNGICVRTTRYIGETCWNGWFGRGDCAGVDTSYAEYSTSCYDGTCMPLAWVTERNECDCAWLGYNFIVACSASGNSCGGHACVLSTGNGNKYCDYATSPNWGSII